jgi:hypothetical protein
MAELTSATRPCYTTIRDSTVFTKPGGNLRGLEPPVGTGDTGAHPNPTGAQPAQELPPERLGLGLTDVQADDLTAAALVDAVGDHQRLVPDPAGLADPFHLGVQPQIRVAALQRPLQERPHLLVQAAAQPGHLVLGHAGLEGEQLGVPGRGLEGSQGISYGQVLLPMNSQRGTRD